MIPLSLLRRVKPLASAVHAFAILFLMLAHVVLTTAQDDERFLHDLIIVSLGEDVAQRRLQRSRNFS